MKTKKKGQWHKYFPLKTIEIARLVLLAHATLLGPWPGSDKTNTYT